jgi:FdhE protein
MTQIVKPGEVGPPPSEIPRLLMPDRTRVFAGRATRLRQLAEGNPLGDYLGFLAVLAAGQQAALDRFPDVPLPDERQRTLCREHGIPPLAVTSWPRAPAWQRGLAQILEAAAIDERLPDAARAAIQRLRAWAAADLEDVASRVLAAEYAGVDPAAAPFVGAALQVYWVHLATALEMDASTAGTPANLCPVCGSRPVASIVHSGGNAHGLRYLSCSLCATRWHLVRTKCVNCDSARGLGYYTADGTRGSGSQDDASAGSPLSVAGSTDPSPRPPAPGRRRPHRGHRAAVEAEACDECRSYLKVGYMEEEPAFEPTADDLATLTLDLLMAEAGYERFGVNPLLVPGRE